MTKTESSPPEHQPPETPQPVPPQFDFMDRGTIFVLASLLVIAALGFFYFIQSQGLLAFEGAADLTSERYFLEALELRERRLALVLTYRTFLTTMAFAVGMILSALGGLFILRRATMVFDLRGQQYSGNMQSAKLSFLLNSPGVAFMLGGMTIIIMTQWLALPVGAPEIFPHDAAAICSTPHLEAEICSIKSNATTPVAQAHTAPIVAAFCAANTNDPDCLALQSLMTRLEQDQ